MENLKTQIANWLENASPNLSETEQLNQLKKIINSKNFTINQHDNFNSFTELASLNIQKLQHQTNLNHIETGYKEIDEKGFNFNLGEFIVIGGRPAMGKTQLLINLALNISKNMPVYFFTFDLPKEQLSKRILATITHVPSFKMQRNELNEDEKAKILLLQNNFDRFQLYINDKFSQSIAAFKEYCINAITKKGIKVIIVDYLQLMNQEEFSAPKIRERELAQITRTLKNIAREYNVCVIASSQLNRAVEKRGGIRIPIPSDLRGSGAIEQEADKIIFIYRYDYYDLSEDENGESTIGRAELLMAKNNSGKSKTVSLSFKSEIPTFTNLNEDMEYFTPTEKLDILKMENPDLQDFIERFGEEN